MKEFSFKTRNHSIEKLKTEKFDLLIIGGGITGAGVARDAAMRGLKVALIESNDFASGTSSKSSKLIHGGIRYLENMDFNLVFEALSERTNLFEMAPHLVHPLRFMIPLYTNSRVTPFKMGLGMFLYDLLALFQSPELHEKLNKHETLQRMPVVNEAELLGSFVYSDAYMDDDRLVHETLRAANDAGAECVNFVEALNVDYITDPMKSAEDNAAHSNLADAQMNSIKEIQVQDNVTHKKFIIQCDHVVCAVGPWSDIVGKKLLPNWNSILRPTKGIHITLSKQRLNLSSAVVMAAQESSRIVFAIPRHEMIIIGTTDTDFKDDPKNVSVTPEDISYLLKITNQYFPQANIVEADIIGSYAGVRPLVKDSSENEGKTSREHIIISDYPGFTFIAGGKYTTYRLMSEQVVDKVLNSFSIEKIMSLKRCETKKPLNSWINSDNYRNAVFSSTNEKEVHLTERFGLEAFEIIKKFGKEKSIYQLEAYQAIYTTMCLGLVDFFARRVPLILSDEDHGLEYLSEVADIFEQELGWSKQKTLQEIDLLDKYIQKEFAWKKTPLV